jgi:hypothetical protein
MLTGLWATLVLQEKKRPIWALIAGMSWAFGVIARPMPGVLFLATAVIVYVWQRQGLSWRSHLKSNYRFLLIAAIPAALALVVFCMTNHAQTGSIFTTGYHAAHGASLGVGGPMKGQIALSVASSALRQNFWLFGWPCSILFVFWVRGKKSLMLFFGLIAAEYFYRVLAPKSVVATTGPVYVTEIVPLLALATGSGIVQAKRWLEGKGVQWAKKGVLSLVVASILVALVCFWPIQIEGISGSVHRWRIPYSIIEASGVNRALVFADTMVLPKAGVSWAYCTPTTSPTMDEEIIFVRPPGYESDDVASMTDFWRRRFPDRSAWVLQFTEGKMRMIPLGDFEPVSE